MPETFKRITVSDYMLDMSLYHDGKKVTGLGQIWHGRAIIQGFQGGLYGVPTEWESKDQAFVDLRVYTLWEADRLDLPKEFIQEVHGYKTMVKSTDEQAEDLFRELYEYQELLSVELRYAGEQLELF